ncbi:MAG: right-handed parallel beta-helix repeat-containing protein [Kordiimonadaceae bacterium]|nr:right-handed parallel beta-helix repeat-containing protein [Kordiimonadaceae bacterium]MBT6032387.1 right-handed parallel beta-helix repeat-containing protein [Kordiimonadaceae bacterium]
MIRKILKICVILAVSYPLNLLAQSSQIDGIATMTISTADVVVFKDQTGKIFAKSGLTGKIINRSSDATTTIQAAINSLPVNGGKIYISSGSYNLSSTIYIKNKHGVHIEGAARGMQSGDQAGTVLKSDKAIDLIEINGEEFRIFGVTLSNMLLWGTGRDNGKAGIMIKGTTDAMTFYNVGANNHGVGFHLQGGGGKGSGVIDAPQIYFCDPQRNGIGIHIERSHYTKIVGGEFSDNLQYGIFLKSEDPGHQRIQGVKINSMTSVRNGEANIYIGSNTEDITVSGGSDVGGVVRGSGIIIAGEHGGSVPTNIIVSNAHSYNNKIAGIKIGNSNRVLIQGNIITEHDHSAVDLIAQQHGILIEDGAEHVLINGNIIADNKIANITDNSGKAIIQGNSLQP